MAMGESEWGVMPVRQSSAGDHQYCHGQVTGMDPGELLQGIRAQFLLDHLQCLHWTLSRES